MEGPIDVDVADAASLEALPGIGPALARRIVDDRAQRGAFGSLEGLGQVRGVGPRLLDRLAAHVTFSGSPRPPALHGRRPALPRR
ncbi:ComEA family DNA-binding protein [Roseisolibacter agri]|uniref:ComEA family DNA-binding protein n=1 Tax=Roseisolibacter agri TaxID=2014610 RepID=UPI0024E12785|nr:helix-hairpin-helix domain-containing protein [Roseisolibacter agri]